MKENDVSFHMPTEWWLRFMNLPSPSPRRLEKRVRETCRLWHYSLRTEEAYWMWAYRFILFHGKRHPNEMGAAEITGFRSFLSFT